MDWPRPAVLAGVRLLMVVLAVLPGVQSKPQDQFCHMADAMTKAVGSHMSDWDRQIHFALNETFNCTTYLEYVFVSRDRIRQEMQYVRSNFSTQQEMVRSRGALGEEPLTWVMTHASKAASLVSAHLHIHGTLAASRQGCVSEHLQLLYLMSLRRLKTLLTNQLRHIWMVFQGTSEHFLQAASEWLSEVTDLFDTDMRTIESVLVGWVPPQFPNETLPLHQERVADGSLATIEILRRDAFDEWGLKKSLLRALLRYVFPRDSQVADLCAGSGQGALWLNETGLLAAYAFDGSENIGLITKGSVGAASLRSRFTLWRSFDYVFCLTAQSELLSPEAWDMAFVNMDAHATRGVVVSCGTESQRKDIVASASKHAPSLTLDEELTKTIGSAAGDAACVFTKGLSRSEAGGTPRPEL